MYGLRSTKHPSFLDEELVICAPETLHSHMHRAASKYGKLRYTIIFVYLPYSTYYKPMMYYKPTPLFSSKFLYRYRMLKMYIHI